MSKILQVKDRKNETKILHLLHHATSKEKAREEYKSYLHMQNRILYIYEANTHVLGIVGIEIKEGNQCEIRQIAVSEHARNLGIGRKLISFLISSYKFRMVYAETDHEAVKFYENMDFIITSLGEKYPGVERFLCEYMRSEG